MLPRQDLGNVVPGGVARGSARRSVFARSIWRIALRDFPKARRSYDISAELEAAPPEALSDQEAEALVDDDVARQILHVTYGSILGDPVLRATLLDVLTADGGTAYARAVSGRVSAHLRALSV